MSDMTLADVSGEMADIDFTMLSTRAAEGRIASRPMSNNGDVEYTGDSYYFAWGHAHMVGEIEADPNVGLTFQGSKGLLGAPPMFIAVEGVGKIIRDKVAFVEHWTPDLDRWFTDGVDTPGVVMIHVNAKRIHYWRGEEEGEIAL
ncbi:pyridoxamine 5'-phosphate oxidase family protein [Plastoroseomonas arctica]|uniref:Pyridoxamine 5'-phosphate oxidase family protein n=1 Tax=Plastoroseomonas arctica TaxID=1509237 RepID=A0AAF1KNX1_9PROT|nr:pyridoxamine 5'-phosphate oxidase family protein [Plastoroseomonas arctica]MBR0656744.1 pyridoxamine 5'-phosphate oxidase family protein [Plastoroseomonas arctica]